MIESSQATTVLLVEDNELNRDMLSRRLTRRGFRVVTALDGETAVKLSRELKPDLILMDMGLPGMNGWEATRAIKQNRETQAIPIVALTAHALNADRERALSAGCDAFETKPVDLEHLLRAIGSLLNGRSKGT
jgi:two-component system cell cycle response regulator DivK